MKNSVKYHGRIGYDWDDMEEKAGSIRMNHFFIAIPCIFLLYNIVFVLSKWSNMYTTFSTAGVIFWMCLMCTMPFILGITVLTTCYKGNGSDCFLFWYILPTLLLIPIIFNDFSES